VNLQGSSNRRGTDLRQRCGQVADQAVPEPARVIVRDLPAHPATARVAVHMFRKVRRHRHHAGNGRRLDFPQFHRRLDFHIDGLVVRGLHGPALRSAIARASHQFKDWIASSRGPAVGIDGREDRIGFGALGSRKHSDAVLLGLAGTQKLRVARRVRRVMGAFGREWVVRDRLDGKMSQRGP